MRYSKKQDTIKVNLLSSIAFEYNSINPTKGIEYASQGISLSKKLHYEKGLAQCYNTIGVCYWAKSDFPKSLEYYFKALKINESIDDKKGIAKNLGNIGIIFQELSSFKEALKYYFKALKIDEEINDKKGIASNLLNIGNVYTKTDDYSKALNYYFKALKINEELGKKAGIAINLGNIGAVYQKQGNYSEALKFIFNSLKINKELNRKRGVMLNLGNIGEIYLNIVLDTAYRQKVKEKFVQVNKKYFYIKHSIKYSLKAAEIAYEINANNELTGWYSNLSKAYKELKDWGRAYHYSVLCNQIKDSIFSQESKNKITSLEFQKEKELKDKEIKIQKLEIERREIIIYYTIAAAFLIALLAFFIYTRFRIKQKSNLLLESKNIEISYQKEMAERAFFNIKMMSEIGQKITKNLSVVSIIDTVFDNVSVLMNSTVFGIGVFNRKKNRLEFYGAKELNETLPFFYFDLTDENHLAVYCFKNQVEIRISNYKDEVKDFLNMLPEPKAGKNTESILYLPLNTKEKKIGVISVQSFEKNAYSVHHLDILRNLSIYVAIALDNAEAYNQIENQNVDIDYKNKVLKNQNEEIIQKNNKLIELNNSKDKYLSLLKAELKLAAEYVKSLIPPSLDSVYVKTKWLYIPSLEVGGDSLGYHWIDEDNFSFYLIDVSGHGVGPSLHTVSIINSIKNETLPNVNFRIPEEVLTALNDTYKMKDYNDIYFTMWYGVYNKKSRILTYAGAGHPPAFIITTENKVLILESSNIVVGFVSGFKYQSYELKIDTPLKIYIFSDGVYEIRQKNGTYWKLNEMFDYLKNNNTDDNLMSLYNHVRELRGKKHLDDDFSILKVSIE
ncbi:MAG: tetratricopeptide repeat protein [bacterium]